MQPNRTLSPEIISDFVQKCQLENYANPIAPPNKDRAGLKQWLDNSIASNTEGRTLLEFLGLKGGDRQVFQHWVLAESPVDSWERSILLAKALRNMTAHGALSASKVGELGLRHAFTVLPKHLSEIIHAAFCQLL